MTRKVSIGIKCSGVEEACVWLVVSQFVWQEFRTRLAKVSNTCLFWTLLANPVDRVAVHRCASFELIRSKRFVHVAKRYFS